MREQRRDEERSPFLSLCLNLSVHVCLHACPSTSIRPALRAHFGLCWGWCQPVLGWRLALGLALPARSLTIVSRPIEAEKTHSSWKMTATARWSGKLSSKRLRRPSVWGKGDVAKLKSKETQNTYNEGWEKAARKEAVMRQKDFWGFWTCLYKCRACLLFSSSFNFYYKEKEKSMTQTIYTDFLRAPWQALASCVSSRTACLGF